MKIGAIIQARTSSSRLPKKVLRELPLKSGITILEHIIQRLKKSQFIDEIVVATTFKNDDRKIAEIAKKEHVHCFKGSELNVLERYYLAAKKYNLDVIIRITGDCPCIDPQVVDMVIQKHLKEKADYTANFLTRTFPRGLDVEVFNFKTLTKVYQKASSDFDKEHVSPYIYKTKPDIFRIAEVRAQGKLNRPDIRITVDTEEDYILLCALFDFLFDKTRLFTTENIIDLFNSKPWLNLINSRVTQKKIFDNIEEEIKEATRILSDQELINAKKILETYLNKVGTNH